MVVGGFRWFRSFHVLVLSATMYEEKKNPNCQLKEVKCLI